MKKIILSLIAAIMLVPTSVKADEGMWFLMFIERLNHSDMQKNGLQLTSEEIYSINNHSLKDAIVQFNGGCTAEIVSKEGLVLTNHHCGYSAIAELSTAEQNYLKDGFYVSPTIFKGHNKMRIFQEEIFGPVVCVTTFKTTEEAIAIANDTMYGLGAGVWTRDAHELYQVPRAIQAGRVWVNQYHAYPAGAPFGGYKQSGIGRENHKMMLGHYRQTKNMLISYDKKKLGFF